MRHRGGSEKTPRALSIALAAVFVIAGTLGGTLAIALTPAPAAAGPAGSVKITAPKTGAYISGDHAIRATTTGLVTEVTFGWSRDGETWTPIGVDADGDDGWSTNWDTRPYSGSAYVRARANDPLGPAEDVVWLIVDNMRPATALDISRHAFSPNHDGVKDATRMTLRADEKAHLKISVLTAGGEVRRTWVKEKGTRLSVVWGGRGEDSDLGDGRYTIVGKATDRAGLSRSSKGATLVDTQAPKIHWKHPRPRVTNGLERETFRFRSEDRSPRVHLHLEAFDHTGLVARTKNVRRGEGDGHIKWKPHYANGRALTPGRFTARLRVTDDAGNSMVSGRTKWRVYRDVKAKAYSRMEDVGSRVALTFDDCLEENAWSRILATLRNFSAHGTFFCPGQYVYRYPEMARRSVADGNTIGSHAWDHALLTNKSAYQTEWRLEKDRKAWWEVTGDSPAPFFRPPYGGYDSDVLEGAGNASFPRVILWDVDPQDWRRPSPATIAAKVLDNVQPGSIVLMHVLDHTASALPTIMRGLQRRGLTPVTLAEMFRAGGLR